MENNNKRKISVTEALVELKLYDSKINKAIASTPYIGAAKKSSDKVGAVTKDAFISASKSGYQSIQDLIKNRALIKSAIVQSNANTNVEIGGKTYTVAEAIEKKNSIVYDEYLLQAMKEAWSKATNAVGKENLKVDNTVDTMLNTFLGKDSEKKVSEGDLAAISDPYREKNEWALVDPLDLYGEITRLDNEIAAFKAEVDVKLSVSNSVTYIEV